ncbi:MAG: transposase [Candidatus Omnitrophota bacterium]
MARPYRLQGENCFYHITSRGDDRKRIFISDYDFEKFLEYLEKAKEKYKFKLYAYCLMSNHYHLFIETLQPNLSKIMQYLNTAYTVYYNKKRKKTGHLFQGRYKSIMVDEDSYFLELTRYIHLNPVRAKMVERPGEYKWSSYKGYLKNKTDKYIDYDALNDYLGMDSASYKEFVSNSINREDSLFKEVYAGFFLGGKAFIEEKLAEFRPEIEEGDFAHKRKLRSEISIEEIIKAVGAVFKENNNEVLGKKNSQSNLRKIAIYLARRITQLSNKEIGAHFNISDSAVGKAVHRVSELLQEDQGLKKRTNELFSVFRV